jgi:hypothetical protein
VVTNDGNAILREIDIAHPAAKVCQILLFTFFVTLLMKVTCCNYYSSITIFFFTMVGPIMLFFYA